MKAYQVSQFLKSKLINILGEVEESLVDNTDAEVQLERNLYVQVTRGKTVILYQWVDLDTKNPGVEELLVTTNLQKLADKVKEKLAFDPAVVKKLPYMASAYGGMTAGQKAALTKRARGTVATIAKPVQSAAYVGLTAGQKAALTKKLRAQAAAAK